MGEKKIFASQGALNNQILKKFAQKGHKRLCFTQLFVPISNFALEIVNFELAVQGIKWGLEIGQPIELLEFQVKNTY